MKASSELSELFAALAKAQGAIEGASKDKANPFFKSKYADLASCWAACRIPLAENGLSVQQHATAEGPCVTVTTILGHASGQWMSSELTMTAKEDTPQGIGSCLTYARRYALSAIVGIAPEDDDGNAATMPTKAAPKPEGYDEWIKMLELAATHGTENLRGFWLEGAEALRAATPAETIAV